jgi:hypothetical protein
MARLPVVWKSIESVGRLGVIARSVPRHCAILILRHPCGYVSSVLRGEAEQKFTDHEPASDDYGVFAALLETRHARARGLSLAALAALHPVERLAWRWALFNEQALDDIAGVPGCMHVRYEDVCADPLGQARELLAFAGLPWHAQTDDFVRKSISRDSGTYYSVFRDPVRAATSWRERLPADDARRVFDVLATSRLADMYPVE